MTETEGLRHDYRAIVGRGERMLAVLRRVDRATDVGVPVVLQGESGTGKELIARCLHRNGPRRQAPFVAVNCAAIPESLLESQLFGHARGAFTGAHRDVPGLFAQAHTGTLFLDEVSEMSLPMQAKLLRTLQEREILPVGESTTRPVDVRIICATNADLSERVRRGRFREDLFYRLDVLRITLPPLRERSTDLPELCQAFLRPWGKTLSPEALERALRYPWPGNVRELQNALQRAAILAPGTVIGAEHLDLPRAAPDLPAGEEPLARRLERAERDHVAETLARLAWSRARAAAALGIDRSTLYRLMKKHGIEEPGPARPARVV
ncbi:MAG TPA: sigma 54-interacting transcriptional regulator [Planctomycetota bacterium]|nr:sigma 54-interacting transcriptional regulator [Planctomycetota bacterium]